MDFAICLGVVIPASAIKLRCSAPGYTTNVHFPDGAEVWQSHNPCGYDSEIVRFPKRLQRRTSEQLPFDGAEERRNIRGLHKVVVYLRVDGLEGRFKGRIPG